MIMKNNILTFAVLAAMAALAASCKGSDSLRVIPTSGVVEKEISVVNGDHDDAYYEALREWKKGVLTNERSISYIFFADYGSLAFRFSDIPDSMDVVNLWGGCPKVGSLDYKEMKEMQAKKGTKVVGCKLTRIINYGSTWGYDAKIPSFMEGYNRKYEDCIASGMSERDAHNDALAAGRGELAVDIRKNKTKDADGNFPEWVVYAAKIILDEVEQYGLDGYDLDYEPEGDPLTGNVFKLFLEYLSQYMGPKSGTDKLLIVDRNSSCMNFADLYEYCNYWVYQKYGSTGGASPTGDYDYPTNTDPSKGWTAAHVIVTENIGDTWKTGGSLENFARFQPSWGMHKGGFAGFHGQRDMRTTADGADKDLPYGHFRRGIQFQNPAKK